MLKGGLFVALNIKNIFRTKPKYLNLDDYIPDNNLTKQIELHQAETLNKSMPKGKALQGSSVVGLDGSKGGTTKIDTFHDGTMIQKKKVLHDFSQNIIVQSIIRTRNSQIRKYTRPANESTDGVGFEIVPKDPKAKLTPQKQNAINELEDFIKYTGVDPKSRKNRTFSTFVSQFIYNHYVYDQINVEKVRDSKHKLHHFNLLDAGTIVYDKLPTKVDEQPTYKQVLPLGRKSIKFSPDELTFTVYNDFADDQREGYGYSEVEAALSHLGYHIDTEQFNARFFSQGGTTRGLLVIDSGGSTQANMASLQSLRREWQTRASGLNGAWKIPVISAHDAKFVNMTQSSKDMEFESWLNYLINIISSIFQIQPDEINFPNRGGATSKGGGSSINEGSTQKAKMQQSRDKGLQPLLNHIEDFINDNILPEVTDQYYFRFTLGDSTSELQRQEIIKAKLDNGLTINEARKEMGYEAYPDEEIGNLPGNPAIAVQFLQLRAAKDEQYQQLLQHKNDPNPKKAAHGSPEEGMPVSAIDGKVKSDTAQTKENQPEPTTNSDSVD